MPVVVNDGRPLSLPLIEGMAPDNGTWRAADTLARGADATAMGRLTAADAALIWAAFPDGRRPDARASVALPDLFVACTCAGVRFPCRHILALLLRDHAAPLSESAPPPWTVARLDEATRHRPVSATPATGDAHLAPAAAGLEEMARWLGDLLDRGLAAPASANRQSWLAAADRLADAYAPAAARELRELAAVVGNGADWPERVLPRLGRLAMLAAAFRRLDVLPDGERGDVLAAAGLSPCPGEDRASDVWLVLGRRQTADAGQRHVRTWLHGLAAGRWALLGSVQSAKRLEGVCLPIGARVRGELAYLPSAWPLAAQPAGRLRLDLAPEGTSAINPTALDGAKDDIGAAVADFATARAANPWLRLYPLLLTGLIAEPAPGGWRLRDRGGRLLPLPPRFGYGWQLLALSGDRPLTLFGEYDGATLTPLSVLHGGHWRDPAAWKALP